MRFELGREVKILEKRGGRGDISFYVNIHKHYHAMLGKPKVYRIQFIGDALLLLPVRDVDIEVQSSYTLHNVSEEFKKYLQKIKPKTISCVKVNDYLLHKRVLYEGIIEATIFCKDHEFEHKTLIKYGNGKVEIIEEGLSCGYSGTSTGATVWFIVQLSQRTRVDPEIERIEQIVKDHKLRGKALKVEVNSFENKVIIKPLY